MNAVLKPRVAQRVLLMAMRSLTTIFEPLRFVGPRICPHICTVAAGNSDGQPRALDPIVWWRLQNVRPERRDRTWTWTWTRRRGMANRVPNSKADTHQPNRRKDREHNHHGTGFRSCGLDRGLVVVYFKGIRRGHRALRTVCGM